MQALFLAGRRAGAARLRGHLATGLPVFEDVCDSHYIRPCWRRPRLQALVACRTAKILRWECDTPLAKEMASLEEATDFLTFCLDRADDFTKRDWLASLTLLTMRKRFATSHPLFQRYSQRLLRDPSIFEDNIHLLLHRYSVLGYAPGVWSLLPLFAARLPLLSPKQLALSAWALSRVLVNDGETWQGIGDAFRRQVADCSLPDLAMLAWAFSNIDRVAPPEVVALKRAVREKLMGAATDDVSSHDLCMLFKAIARLTPQDMRFLEWLLLIMLEGMANKTLSFAAQGLTTIWSTLAALRWDLNGDNLEVLCEESRCLRLDHTFNQDMAAEIARALLRLGVDDARPAYQVVEYVARKGLSLRADTLLTLVEFFAARSVMHERAWKRLGVRSQQRAVDLSLPEIERLVAAFRRAGKGNQRIDGMMQLFARLREDQARYGAA